MSTIGRAVVMGGSIAGLGAAAHLAPHADEVVVVERRDPPQAGSIAPQGIQPHVLLMAGAQVLEELFPGFCAELLAAGADPAGHDPSQVACRWYAAGARRDHLVLPTNPVGVAIASRPLVEARLRAHTFALPRVTVVRDTAERLLLDDMGHAAGVHLHHGGPLAADLVVDASGRTAPLVGTPEVPEPPRSEVVVDVRYTTFFVERRPGDFDGGSFTVVQNTRTVPRAGLAVPHESGAWHVCLAGYFGESASADPVAARAFAASLADPALADLVDRPFLSEPRRYHFRSSLRRHWERVAHPVEGYVPIGDTVASFNPIYAQGMSSALLQARALGDEVAARGIAPGLSRRMAKASAKVVAAPWLMATGGDFIYPATVGRRPRGQAAVNAYVDRLTRAAAVDRTVNAALSQVTHLVSPPAVLFDPRIVARVVRHGRRRDSRHPVVAQDRGTAASRRDMRHTARW